MKSTNLAQRLEEFDAVLASLQLTPSPATRVVVPKEAPAASGPPARPARRVRVGGIRISDQGLRGFRIF